MWLQKQRSATSDLASQLKLTSRIPIHKINMLMHLNDSQIIYKYVAPKANIQYRLKEKFVCEVYNSSCKHKWFHQQLEP